MKTISALPGTKLDQFLKYAGLVSTGGEAKLAIQNSSVTINGNIETRRGYKIKDGDIVNLDSMSIKVSLK